MRLGLWLSQRSGGFNLRFVLVAVGTALIAWAIYGLLLTLSGSVEQEMFEAGVSPLRLGLKWLFTFDIPGISLPWYVGLVSLLIGLVLIFRKR